MRLERGMRFVEIENQAAVVFDGAEGYGTAVSDDPVGAGGEEGGIIGSGAQSNYAGAGGFGGLDAGGSVFDDDTVGRGELERLGAAKIGLRVGLAAADVASGNEISGNGNSGSADSDDSKRMSRRGDHGEAIGRQGAKKFRDAGQGDDVNDIVDFGLFDFAVFGVMIAARE